MLFYILFRELFSIWTANWLLWFGLVFVGFVLYSPGGLVGIWAKLMRRWRPPPEEVGRDEPAQDLPGPARCRRSCARSAAQGSVLEVDGISKKFGGIRAVDEREPHHRARAKSTR